MGNYPLNEALITREAAWFGMPEEGTYITYKESHLRTCYRCGDKMQSFEAHVHPCMGDSYTYSARQICKTCYDLAKRVENKR